MKALAWLGMLAGVVMSVAACPPALAALPPDPDDLLLRLSDVPAGYVVGDDSGCGFQVGEEEAPPELDAIDRAHENIGCGIELDRDWVARGAAPAPREIDGTVFAFEAPAGAAAAFEARLAIIEHHLGDRPERLAPIAVRVALGDASAAYVSSDALVNGRPRRPGVVIAWRSGALLGLLHLGGRRAVDGLDNAFALAQAQQARMAAPTPIGRGENDDTLVPLGDPDLPVAIHWLGRRFDPPGALPPLRVVGVQTHFHPLDPLKWRVTIAYDARGDSAGIGLWTRGGFTRFRRSEYGRRYFRPCVAVERVTLRRGAGLIRTDGCGAGRPRFRFAQLTRGRTVVTLQLPSARAGERPRATGYHGRAGLETLLRGLARRR